MDIAHTHIIRQSFKATFFIIMRHRHGLEIIRSGGGGGGGAQPIAHVSRPHHPSP